MSEEFEVNNDINKTKTQKSKAKLIITVVVSSLIIGITCICVGYFTSDNYKYTQAIKEMQSGNFEDAFEVIYELYPDDVLLPFNGLYTNISIGDKRTLQFENGKYTQKFSSDSSDVNTGTYKTYDYSKAICIDDEDMTTDTYRAYQNYIYQCEDEDFVFDEKVDISKGLFNGQFSEKVTFGVKEELISWDLLTTYIFEDDGTYTEVTKQSEIGSTDPYATHRYSGTYIIEDNLLILSPNDEEDETKSFLVLDNLVYRIVYERDYTSDLS